MKTIEGYEGSFIDTSGVIKNKSGIRKTYVSRGYEKIILTKNNKSTLFSVHRLVAMAFIPNPENKEFVNHINGNKLDNRVQNLEWCTRSENTIHAYKLGMCKRDKGESSPHSKKIYQIDINTNKVIGEFLGVAELQRKLGFSNISRAAKFGRIANGYKWSYTKQVRNENTSKYF